MANKKREYKQQGFALPELLFAVVFVAAIALIAWLAYQQIEMDETAGDGNRTTTDEAEKETPEGWAVYENEGWGFSFAYPDDWLIVEDGIFKNAYLALRSIESQENINAANSAYRDSVALKETDLVVDFIRIERAESVIYQHEKDIDCNSKDPNSLPESCRSLIFLEDAYEINDRMIYEATTGPDLQERTFVAIVNIAGDTVHIELQFRNADSKENLSDEQQKLLESFAINQ